MKYSYIDRDGKGHLPIGDAAHVRNALARFGQTFFESEAKATTAWSHIVAAARRFGIDVSDKSMPKPRVKKPSEGYKRASATAGEHRLKPVATCAVAISVAGDIPPEWVELIPAGQFNAVDGRGPFVNDEPDAVVNASVARMPQVGLVIDFDHSTDLAAPEGRPAPAAGWLKEFKVERGAIFARVEWTRDAAAAVKEKHYRYVSPVFEHDKEGKVERILRAALTNNPALINLPAIASAQRQQSMARKENMAEDGEKPLQEIVAGLCELFPQMPHKQILQMAMGALDTDDDYDSDTGADDGMAARRGAEADDAYENESEEQMAARQTEEMARCRSDEERTACARKHEAEKERFARRIKGLEVQNHNEKSGAAAMNAAVAKDPMVVRMAADLNAMRAEQARKTAETAVDAAIREGRLIPSQRDWAIEYCSSDPKGFGKFLGAQLRIIQSGTDGTFTGRIGEAPRGATALSAREVEIFANLGLESKEQLEKCAALKEKWELKFPRPSLRLDDSNSGNANNGAAQ